MRLKPHKLDGVYFIFFWFWIMLEVSSISVELLNLSKEPNLLDADDQIDKSMCCPVLKDLLINEDIDQFFGCGSLNICNSTSCIRFEETSLIWLKEETLEATSRLNRTVFRDFVYDPSLSIISPDDERIRKTPLLTSNTYNNLRRFEAYPPLQDHPYAGEIIDRLALVKPRIGKLCKNLTRQNIFITGYGKLPDYCTVIRICSEKGCIKLPLISFFTAQNVEKDSGNKCSLIAARKWERRRRAPITNYKGLLKMNLPGYRYCGPGTDIESMDAQGGPVNDLDDACREHDIDYMLGADPASADKKFLNKVYEVGGFYYYLFYSIFKSKQMFEGVTGETYTSSLYFTEPGSSPSLTMLFASHSAIDLYNGTDFEKMKSEEARWMNIAQDIWKGYCQTKEAPEDADTPTESASKQSKSNTEAPEEQQTQRGTDAPSSSEAETGNVDASYVAPAGYPRAPWPNGCRLLINEVTPYDENKPTSFIEHRRVCPKGKNQPKSKKLGTFVEMVLESGDVIMQNMYANFKAKSIQVVAERSASHKEVNSYYFMIGKFGDVDVTFESVQTSPSMKNGLPSPTVKAICIVLLYFDSLNEAKAKLLQLQMGEEGHLSTALTDERMDIIKEFKQDVVVIGPPCLADECKFFFDLVPRNPPTVSFGGLLLPIPVETEETTLTWKGFSRCSDSVLPMQLESFQISEATPRRRNKCEKPSFNYPFKLSGTGLQKTAQKIIVNAKHFLDASDVEGSLLVGSSTDKTSKLLGISKTKVYQVLQNYKNQCIKTPGKKRPRESKIMKLMDDLRVEVLKKVIQQFYSSNRAPTLDMIYNQFMKDMQEEEDGHLRRGEDFDAFQCSKTTFRSILKKLGFKFGKINKRSVVLMRQDIVAKRREYLVAMKNNRESAKPKVVIYTDETWLDPHSRTGKGWLPRKPESFRDASKYSYQKARMSRGGRIIILHAGSKFGFVPGVMKVYPVSKKKLQDDYHENVNHKQYFAWWRLLLQKAKEHYGECIIVIDNAPYHGASDTPKSSTRKAEMYAWITDNIPLSKRASLGPITNYLKVDLWNQIKQMKNTNRYFLVDIEAEKYGHQVVRLPPYNCDLNPIEQVWGEIKNKVRKENTEATTDYALKVAEDTMNCYTALQWEKQIQHIEKLEQKYWEEDRIYDSMLDHIDNEIDPSRQLRIVVDEDSEDEDDSDDDEGEFVVDTFRATIHDDVDVEELDGEEEDMCDEELEVSTNPKSKAVQQLFSE